MVKNSLWARGLQPPIWDLQSRVRSDSDGLWRVAVALAPRPGHGDRGRPVGYAALRLQALTAASADGCMLDQLQAVVASWCVTRSLPQTTERRRREHVQCP